MGGSDSFSLDNMLEALLMGGMDLLRAMRLLLPPAWQNVETMAPELRGRVRLQTDSCSMIFPPWSGYSGWSSP